MALLRTEHIKEIAAHVAEGIEVFVHKKTRAIRAMVGLNSDDAEERAKWQAAYEAMKTDAKKEWLLIPKVSMDDELYLRKGFIPDVEDNHVKRQLTNALNRNNPMRNFHIVVEGDEILHQHWLNYRRGAYQKWVSDFVIAAYNY